MKIVMKQVILLIVYVLLVSCWPPADNPPIYSMYEPEIMTRSDFDNSIVLKEVKEIQESGKIYVIGDFLYINDKNSGFHILNNNNPKTPFKQSFIEAPGATDVAVRNNTLYINQATDLVVLTLNNSTGGLNVEKRLKNVFPVMMSPDGYFPNIEDNEVVVNWKLK
ncbi:hypothetical protein SAMN05444411_10878 [Lutibacter oricola]|uniref:LVIVD repeat-containing protein n=2 Tax=Lutibacter oricola TaxID=762486 RepID=A0A1H3DUC9_9FLAO|nr:hypothetical protein SAMN05444411_10878 [Lutibacter oricola]